MESPSRVELADRISRKRAVVVAAAAIVFFVAQLMLRPFFDHGIHAARPETRLDWWAVNAALLLAVLATGGGLANKPAIRALVNDEVSRSHYRTAVVAGYWVAMGSAMGLYVLSKFRSLDAPDAIFVIVTLSISVALLAFSWLELRAHRDA